MVLQDYRNQVQKMNGCFCTNPKWFHSLEARGAHSQQIVLTLLGQKLHNTIHLLQECHSVKQTNRLMIDSFRHINLSMRREYKGNSSLYQNWKSTALSLVKYTLQKSKIIFKKLFLTHNICLGCECISSSTPSPFISTHTFVYVVWLRKWQTKQMVEV